MIFSSEIEATLYPYFSTPFWYNAIFIPLFGHANPLLSIVIIASFVLADDSNNVAEFIVCVAPDAVTDTPFFFNVAELYPVCVVAEAQIEVPLNTIISSLVSIPVVLPVPSTLVTRFVPSPCSLVTQYELIDLISLIFPFASFAHT